MLYSRGLPFAPSPQKRTPSGGLALLAPLGDADAIAQASQDGTQYKLLAEAIPALSFAPAANAVDAFNPSELESRNFHMQTLRNAQGAWPEERLNSKVGDNWLHSDIKDIAYPYIYEFYNEVVSQGGLNHD